MPNPIQLTEKYERNGWPSMPRPDLKPPAGWNLEALTALKRVRNHQLAPDGRHIAFFWDSDDLSDLYIMPSEGGWPGRLSTDRGPTLSWNDEIPQWSPDSQSIAYTAHGHVYLVQAQGGLPKKLLPHVDSTWGPRWMPDSQHLIISLERDNADQLALTNLSGTELRFLTSGDEGDHWDARPAPDGKAVAFVFRRYDDLNRTDICVLNLETGALHTVYGKPKIRAWSPRWSPNGEWLAFLSQEDGHDDLWMAHPDGSGLRQVTRLGLDVVEFQWAPNGKSIAATLNRGGSFELALITPKTGHADILRDLPGLHTNPHWSPGGAFLTFEFESATQVPDLYRIHIATGEVTQLTFSTPPWLQAVQPVAPEAVSYPSFDGLEIPAFLYRPPKPNGAAIVSVHGGPSSQEALFWNELTQYLVAKGYTILAPNYRGSTGYGVEFEHRNYGDWGGGDTQDCLYAAEYLKTLPGLDPSRFAIMGGSYGGYMVNCCLARDPEYRYACGISKYGDADLVNSWALCSRELRYYTEIFLGHPAKNRQVYLNGSPIHEAEKVQKPLLLLHGLKDDIVPPEASEQWAEALRRHGKTFEYKTYASEPHGFIRRAALLDAYRRIEQFLDWYLLP
ncbi:MAG: S9 family peptidase [Anaerolineales bacterium]|nr:S9 family peptidase [Anaerolineales bacterium]MDW8277693.1 S9 family peptidase [Anaerolineales bacterium]